MVRWGLRAVFFLSLLGATHQSLVPRPISALEPIWDKYLHLICWGGLALMLYVAYRPSKAISLQWIALFLYSIAIELGQILVPGRFFSGEDIIANGLGIVLAYGLIRLIEGKRLSPK
jgi:VanZ family protein